MAYQFKNVGVQLNQRAILQNINCVLGEGKWISVIGQTGAGKPTFIQALKGLVPLDYGEYFINGQPAPKDKHGKAKVVSHIGFVFQYPEHQLFETTVYKELSFELKQMNMSKKRIEMTIIHTLSQLGLSKEILPLATFQLSGGQKRLVALASVLVTNPKTLILDEPTAGLDPYMRKHLLNYLKSWQQEDNRTVIIVSHQMDDVAEYSDEALILGDGKLIGHFETETLFLEKSLLLEKAGLILPKTIQLLQIIRQLSEESVLVDGCKEADIFQATIPILHKRGLHQ